MWSIRLKYTEIEKTPSELFAGQDYFPLLPSKYSLDLGKWEFEIRINKYINIHGLFWKEKKLTIFIKDIIITRGEIFRDVFNSLKMYGL